MFKQCVLLIGTILLAGPAITAQQPAPPQRPAALQSIEERTSGTKKLDGYFPLYWDENAGAMYLEIPRFDTDFLFSNGLSAGLGSNDIGLDRGQGGGSRIVQFQRVGRRVLMVQGNLSFRSSSKNPLERKSVEDSFAKSVLWGFPVAAMTGDRVLVDATDFFMRDWYNAGSRLRPGNYRIDRARSTFFVPNTKNFPKNTEVDVLLTFVNEPTGGGPGGGGGPSQGPAPIGGTGGGGGGGGFGGGLFSGSVGSVTPSPDSVTLREHISFVELPDNDYQPRYDDPRAGYGGLSFIDYSTPIGEPMQFRYVRRHRLQKKDPAAAISEPIKPIQYWVDSGAPEDVKKALVEGASWWNQAFEAAGFRNAFKVDILPDGADPMDIRYNMINWVHRSTRGWSTGGSVSDPRTGEIIKGMARMDSHRARTDYNLYAALLGADAAAADTAFVLARVRQVSAHEVGHTLGMAHNYIASIDERSSVMDYPAPRARLSPSGDIDVSQAYGRGPGDYDVWAIRWGYGIFPAATERDSLAAIVAEGLRKGYLYLGDGAARPESASDPRTNLWDDAASPLEFLRHQTEVRRVALNRFGLRNIRAGEPVSTLQERLAPLYFWHRFALNGAVKTIGGMEYSGTVRGDNQTATRPIDGRRGREALSLLLAQLQPNELAIPDTVITLLAPRPAGFEGAVNNTNSPVGELFRGRTDPAFDELSAARTLAQMIVDGILQRERAARLVAFASRGANMLTLGEAIDSLVARTWGTRAAGESAKNVALRRVTQRAVADRLLMLAADADASPEVRAMAEYQIGRLRALAQRNAGAGDTMNRAHWSLIAGDFARWTDRRELPRPTTALAAPPGDPFGVEP